MRENKNNNLKGFICNDKGFTKQKGFSVVELVIVIAVIGILAAVLIPTFNRIIEKADESRATQEVTNAMKEFITINYDLDLDNVLVVYLDKELLDYENEVDPEYSYITSDKLLNEKILYIFDYVNRNPKILGYENVSLYESRLIISGNIYERLDTSKLNNFPDHIRIFQKKINQDEETLTLTIDPRSTNISSSEISRVEGNYVYGEIVQINLMLEEGYLLIYENELLVKETDSNIYTITITKNVVIRIEHANEQIKYLLSIEENSLDYIINPDLLDGKYAKGEEIIIELNTLSIKNNDKLNIYINNNLVSTYIRDYDDDGNIVNIIRYTLNEDVILDNSLNLELKITKFTNLSYIGFDSITSGICDINASDVLEIRMIDYDLFSKNLYINTGISSLQFCKCITKDTNLEYIVNFMKYLKNTKLNIYLEDNDSNSEENNTDYSADSTIDLIPIDQMTRYVIITEEDIYTVDIREIINILRTPLPSLQVNVYTYKLEDFPEAFPTDANDGFMFDDYDKVKKHHYQAEIYTKLDIVNHSESLDDFDVRRLLLGEQIYTHTNNYDEVNQLYFEYNEMTIDILHGRQICVNLDDYYSMKFDIIGSFAFDEYKINLDVETVTVNLIDGTYTEIGGYDPYNGTNITYMKSAELTSSSLLEYINIDIPSDKELIFLKIINYPIYSSDRYEELFVDSNYITLEEDITIIYQLVDINGGDDINPLSSYETVYLVSNNGLSLAPEGKTALTLHNPQLVISSMGKVRRFIYHWQELKETFETIANPRESSSVVTPYVKAEDYFDESLFDDYFVLLVLRNDCLLYTEYSDFNYTPDYRDIIAESNQIILSSYISSICYSHDFVIIPKEDLYQEITDEEIINIKNALGEDVLLEHIYFKHDNYYVYSSSPFLYPDVELAILEHSILGYTFYAYENTDIKVYKAGETPEILDLADVKDEEWFKNNINYIHCSYYSKNPYLRNLINTNLYSSN